MLFKKTRRTFEISGYFCNFTGEFNTIRLIKNMKRIIFITLLTTILAACKSSHEYESNGIGASQSISLTSSDSIIKPTRNFNDFTINMFDHLHKDIDNNFICSPLGVASLFRIIQDGASGKTQKELGMALGVSSKEISEIALDLQDEDGYAMVKMANLLAVNDKYKVESQYTEAMKALYGAKVSRMDFNNSSSVNEINEWVYKNTGGMIGEIIEQLSSTAILYAINTLYFNGRWENKFEGDTEKRKFIQEDGKKTIVDMMNNESKYAYACNDTFQIIRLPYKNRPGIGHKQNRFSMVIILPRKGKVLDDVMGYLHQHTLQDIYLTMSTRKVNVMIPKFDTDSELDVLSLLRSLGVRHLGDLSGISSEEIEISESKQIAKIRVDEEGTEAAAVTRTDIELKAAESIDETYFFTADHPFIYFIENEESGKIYFMGKFIKGRDASSEEMAILEHDDNDTRTVIKPKEYDASHVFDVVETMPSFPGGMKALQEYMKKELDKYKDKTQGKYGRVVIQFVVDESGNVNAPKIAKSVEPAIDKVAMKVIRNMPKWNPGFHHGKCVKVRYTLPVTFREDFP